MALRVAELETLFTANIRGFLADAARVESAQRSIAGRDTTVVVDADSTSALADLARVESSARALPDAAIEVTADTSSAQADLAGLGDEGAAAGRDAGEGLSDGILGALVALPIAGTVIGIGAAIGKSLVGGLQVEVRSDRLMAQTGLDAATVAILARASGEAYAANFGESISANMTTARAAVQSGLLNPGATARDSEAVISSLSGIADLIGEEIPRVSRSTAQLLRTGLAKDAAGAFDIIVKGSQAGLNVSEDWLDTLDEYSTQFRKLGLDGGQTMGLISQGLKAGARDTDTVADALKEFAIRAVDGSVTTKAGFDGIGLSAQTMAAAITSGGPAAAAALDETLDKLRAVEDPATRAQLAVALFGTKAEDLGDALYAMDLTTATEQLGMVAGAARSALDTMGDNAASDIASAQRNIEVAADGIKGALATAFAPQIEGFSTFVTENREAVMNFLLDLANGGLDAGIAFVEFTASSTEAIGGFISGPLADLADSVANILDGMSWAGLGIPGAQDAASDMRGFSDSMRSVQGTTDDVAATIRTNLIDNGLRPAQDRLNAVAIPMIAQAALHDASVRLAGDIDAIGYAADGSKLVLDTLNGTVDTSTASGLQLDGQIRAMVDSLNAESTAGTTAQETQAVLAQRYAEGRAALEAQLVAMGFTTDQAKALADQYGAIPPVVDTVVGVTGYEDARSKLDGLGRPITKTVDIQITGYEDARAAFDGLGRPIKHANGAITGHADGALRVPQIAKGGANILWAEDETIWEAYISGKPGMEARNAGILAEAAHRLGFEVIPAGTQRHADGALAGPATAPASSGRTGPLVEVRVERLVEATPSDVADTLGWAIRKAGIA